MLFFCYNILWFHQLMKFLCSAIFHYMIWYIYSLPIFHILFFLLTPLKILRFPTKLSSTIILIITDHLVLLLYFKCRPNVRCLLNVWTSAHCARNVSIQFIGIREWMRLMMQKKTKVKNHFRLLLITSALSPSLTLSLAHVCIHSCTNPIIVHRVNNERRKRNGIFKPQFRWFVSHYLRFVT